MSQHDNDITNINVDIKNLQNTDTDYFNYFNQLRGITNVYNGSNNLNSYTVTQIVVVHSDVQATTANNFPISGMAGLLVVESGYSDAINPRYVYQKYITRDNSHVYSRIYNIDTWTDWEEIANNSISGGNNTYELIAETTSKTTTNNIAVNLAKYKELVLYIQISSTNKQIVAETRVSVDLFKTISSIQTRYNVDNASHIVYCKYVNDNNVYLYTSDGSKMAILYGII